VRQLRDAGIGSPSPPAAGARMRFLIEPLGITLPVGPSTEAPSSTAIKPDRAALIPASAAERSLEVLDEFGVDIGCSPTINGSPATAMANTFQMKSGHPGRTDHVKDFSPYLSVAARSSAPVPMPRAATLRSRDAEGVGTQATAVDRRAIISTSRAGLRQRHLRAGDGSTFGISTAPSHHRRHAERSGDVQEQRPLDRHG